MADNRYNQMTGYRGHQQMGPRMPAMSVNAPGVPINPMMQQQMMMRFPMQGMRMGPPSTPPPPYSVHQQPGVVTVNTPRPSLNKSKGTHPKSEKERFYEEQRQKMKQFGKPGAMKVDADSLIGSMFKVDSKPMTQKSKSNVTQTTNGGNEDDGFGDFLQGPATTSSVPDPLVEDTTLSDGVQEHAEPSDTEKKDLTSMMLECSDLTAPQKAKGFHKPTLNEVHRPRQLERTRKSSFHESDHSRSWKSAYGLDGLFQLPAQPVPAPASIPVQQSVQPMPAVNTFHAVGQTPPLPGVSGIGITSGAVMMSNTNVHINTGLLAQPTGPPPTGPPPSYSEASTHPTFPQAPGVSSGIHPANPIPNPSQATPPVNQNLAQTTLVTPPPSSRSTNLPDWCSFNEFQVPPVYKQIYEASLVDGRISTDRLYPILLLSGLPREMLAHLWSMCNTGTPGQLVKTELWLILALIALKQNNCVNIHVTTLCQCPAPPIPIFSTGQAPVPTTVQGVDIQQHKGDNDSVTLVSQAATIGHHQPSAMTTPPPLPQSSSSMTTAAMVTPTQVTESTEDDDFADFQAAPTATSVPPNTIAPNVKNLQQQKEETFGEFIGGGAGGDGGSNIHAAARNGPGGLDTRSVFVDASHGNLSDPLDFPPYIPPRHCSNQRSGTSMGNGHIPSGAGISSLPLQRGLHHNHNHYHQPPLPQVPLSQPHQGDHQTIPHPKADGFSENERPATMGQLDLASQMPSLSAMCLEDKYSGNVRSFFCSSDSSTGHTSPSFEDDDFTDGRDSFSQVSTSEQSEIDDIHNFEHYVEEFNHNKKEAVADGSPLHCPFPSVTQNHIQTNTEGNITTTPVSGDDKKLPVLESNQRTHNHIVTKPGFNKLKSAHIPPPPHDSLSHKPSVHSTQPSAKPNDADDDGFADFKSGSAMSSDVQPSNNTIPPASGRDDRYGALRDITQEADLMQSSVFYEPPTSPTVGNPVGTGNGSVQGTEDEDEEWANFSEAPAPSAAVNTNQNENHFFGQTQSVTSSMMASDNKNSGKDQASDVKEDILKLFASSVTTPHSPNLTTSVSESIGSMVNSDSGYSTKSWDATRDPLTSMFDSSLSTNQDKPTKGDKAGGDTFWTQTQTMDSGIENKWAAFGMVETLSSVVNGSVQDMESTGFTSNAFQDTTEKNSGLGQSASMPTITSSNVDTPQEDDWGDFSHMTASDSNIENTNNNVSDSSPSIGFTGSDSMVNSLHTNSNDIRESAGNNGGDWADFSTAPSQNEAAGDIVMDGMVTIKKQNLGTNEIMGLFKVRDDPATLFTYQLPPQTPPTAGQAGHSRKSSKHSRSNSAGSRRQLSSEFDDDMVPPPMDSDVEDGDDDHTFSRGYDLDDLMHRAAPVTTYSPFGSTSSPVYSRASIKATLKLKESKEDSGSVNSLELPSTQQTFDGSSGHGADSQSTCSMDMVTTNSGIASVESKSLDSLDFTSSEFGESTEEAGRQGGDPPPSSSDMQQQQHRHSSHPIQPQELLASMPQLADKYNIGGVAEGNDRYSYEWERCLEKCFNVLAEANTLFNNISSSSVCNEVLKSLQGWEYVSCVIEIYRVACRVMTAMKCTAISSTDLEQTLKEIDLMWNNLSAFLVGASLLPDPASLVFTNAILKSDDDSPTNSSSACGICLLNVNLPITSTTTSSLSPSSSLLSSLASSSSTLPSACIGSSITSGINTKLTFAGCHYHSTCANFWVNCVDQTLPSLLLPQLL